MYDHKSDKIKEFYMKKDEKKSDKNKEDTTKYGEFVSSYFAWISPEEQKKKAEELDKKTENN